METARPAPGTLNDLLADAADLGMRDASERRLREWTRLGLLGSPTRQSLGRGHGQAPALYSSRQRALFHAVVHHRVLGHKNATLAQIPVWAWLFNSDPGVTLDQLKKALGTALGSETMSKRAADQAAKLLVDQIKAPGAAAADVRRLREVVSEQILQPGPHRADLDQLRTAVERAMSVRGVPIARGPWPAILDASYVTALLERRIRAARHLKSITDLQYENARARHQREWAHSAPVASAFVQQADPEMTEALGPKAQIEGSVATLLIQLGFELEQAPPPETTP